MCSSKQIKELAECNAVYEFEKAVNMYGKEYIRYYYNKLAELNGSINSTCNCQRNSNSIVVDVMCAMFKNLNIKQGDSNEALQAN